MKNLFEFYDHNRIEKNIYEMHLFKYNNLWMYEKNIYKKYLFKFYDFNELKKSV